MRHVVDILVVAVIGLFLVLALSGSHPTESILREHLLQFAEAETGVVNLVSGIYLGYRAFDTLGETIVLLLAVSGVMVLVERRS